MSEANEKEEIKRHDYSKYTSYETSDDHIVVYDTREKTAWIKIEEEQVVEPEEML